MIDEKVVLQELEQLKGKVEELEKERVKLEARKDQLMEQLEKKGITSLAQAKEVYAQKMAERQQALEAAARTVEEIKHELADYL